MTIGYYAYLHIPVTYVLKYFTERTNESAYLLGAISIWVLRNYRTNELILSFKYRLHAAIHIPCYLCAELLYRRNERKYIQGVMSIWALSNYRTNEPILRFRIDIDYMLLYICVELLYRNNERTCLCVSYPYISCIVSKYRNNEWTFLWLKLLPMVNYVYCWITSPKKRKNMPMGDISI